MENETLIIWTVYDHPKDFPDEWVLRAHDVPGGPRKECKTARTLAEIRAHVPPGLVCLRRHIDDDKSIYETWF